MQFAIGLFCFLVFLYYLYLLSKDDYILIRKNFLLEQFFDLAIIATLAGIIIARVFSIIFHPISGVSFLSQLFSISLSGVTLTELVMGTALAIYLIMKYRKLPVGHLFDFLSLALLSTLPIVYLVNIFFVKRNEIIYLIVISIIYIICQIIFWKLLLPKVISNKLKEGSMSYLFLLIFSLISLAAAFIKYNKILFSRFEVDYLILIVVFFGSLFLFIRNERKGILKRKA